MKKIIALANYFKKTLGEEPEPYMFEDSPETEREPQTEPEPETFRGMPRKEYPRENPEMMLDLTDPEKDLLKAAYKEYIRQNYETMGSRQLDNLSDLWRSIVQKLDL